MINRVLETWAFDRSFLHNKMSFIAGPRQVGKTTLAQKFLKNLAQEDCYYNWDTLGFKQQFAKNPLFFKETFPPRAKNQWIVFDEIHKYPQWKNLLKGYYDEMKDEVQFIITGSARLDLFRKSGDSLAGRYFLFKLFPLGPKDIVKTLYNRTKSWNPKDLLEDIPPANSTFSEAVDSLYNTTGFPEPFLDGTKDFYNRWKDIHLSLIINEDIRDLTKITHIKKLETLVFLLPERVGSPISLNALRENLECSHESIKTWLEAFNKVFISFDIPPYTKKLSRAILKEKKIYFWDWGIVEDTGKRFENFVAVQLARVVTQWNEWGLGKYSLHYIRTKDGYEVDFAIALNNTVVLLIEVKEQATEVPKSFILIREKLNNPLSFQVIHRKGFYKRTKENILVLGIDRLLQLLP